MNGEVVNLRLARKRRERRVKEEEAAQNRLRFGDRKSRREHNRLSAEKADRGLDAHKLENTSSASATIDETL